MYIGSYIKSYTKHENNCLDLIKNKLFKVNWLKKNVMENVE